MVIINPFQPSFKRQFSLSRPMLAVFPILFSFPPIFPCSVEYINEFRRLGDEGINEDNISGNTK